MLSTTFRGRLLGRIATAFLMTSSLTAASLSLMQSAHAYRQYNETEKANAFWNAGYAYCDAEKLGQYWQMSTYDAKLFAGEKILDGYRNLLDEAIDTAMQSFGCPNGFNFDDSKKLADLWTAIPS